MSQRLPKSNLIGACLIIIGLFLLLLLPAAYRFKATSLSASSIFLSMILMLFLLAFIPIKVPALLNKLKAN